MIHDSALWKRELARDAGLIERWAAKRSRSERRSFLIEQKVFLAAYAMRKLHDATMVSTSLLTDDIAVERFAPTRAGFSEINNHRVDDYFDLLNPVESALSGRSLLNILIHSLVFVEVLDDDDAVIAFMVTSDRESKRGLYRVRFANFIRLMRIHAEDYPTEIHRVFDPVTDRWVTWAGHFQPPVQIREGFEQARRNLSRWRDKGKL